MMNIAKRIEKAIGNPEVILASAMYSNKEGNLRLRDCILFPEVGLNKKNCEATDPSKQNAIEIILPFAPNEPIRPSSRNFLPTSTTPRYHQISSNPQISNRYSSYPNY